MLFRVSNLVSNFPDPLYAKETIWVPFMRDELHCDENTIVVGHSSGSAATMRLLESGTKVAGAVLVSAYYTDLGDDLERDSGYFSRAWDWGQIKQNAGFIAQFHSPQDYLVDVAEVEFVCCIIPVNFHRHGLFMKNSIVSISK